MNENDNFTGLEIAVVGMAGRFPGAGNLELFWENLKKGIESISYFSDEDLEESGVESDTYRDVKYVKAKGVLDDVEYFDPFFFDYTAKEARLMDPQFRVFHECAWEALENAGYDPGRFNGKIGIYAGASDNFYWQGLAMLTGAGGSLSPISLYQLISKDFLTTRISYKLNLRGPSFLIQTACSTSLSAIHTACQGLLSGECAMALAGGVSITLPQKIGYNYQEGMVLSPDGHCRAFDARAQGFIGGNGVGVVVLKSLEDAMREHDHIYAVIKGSAMNNDGREKPGFTAPSVKAQTAVIKAALSMAEVEPESIGYVETHGTGTAIGDPIEIEALKRAFNTGKKGFCKIGSVKTNVGHLDAAAGVAGFIKAILVLKNRQIPPSLFFEIPNPQIEFENSPFQVCNRLTPCENGADPFRIGVTSLGIGGTNVHVVLEEWTRSKAGRGDYENEKPRAYKISPAGPVNSPDNEFHLLLLSAKTQPALDKMTEQLANYLETNSAIPLADVAYTLQMGRQELDYRRMAVCSNTREAVTALRDISHIPTGHKGKNKNRIVFMFAGLGSQYVNMGLDLYRKEPLFRKNMEHCFEILNTLTEYNIKELLYPGMDRMIEMIDEPGHREVIKRNQVGIHAPEIEEADVFNRIDLSQIHVFILEYSLANVIMEWGIKPDAMIGYSFGEYTAACLAGVFSLEDALKIIIHRGALLKQITDGVMFSVPLTAAELFPLLGGELSIAIDNGPSCIVAGPKKAVDSFAKEIKNRKLLGMTVSNSVAMHSTMMEPILEEFEKGWRGVELKNPQIPYISNVTGNWITPEEAVNPAYWSRHLRNTVRFADGIKELLKTPGNIFIEIGPGRDLSTQLVRHEEDKQKIHAVPLLRQDGQRLPDDCFLLQKIGRLWLHGLEIDWRRFQADEKNRGSRIPLPTYPFARRRYWIDSPPLKRDLEMFSILKPRRTSENSGNHFCIPTWKPSPPDPGVSAPIPSGTRWLVLTDESGIGTRLTNRLKEEKKDIVCIRIGQEFKQESSDLYTINPGEAGHYDMLIRHLGELSAAMFNILHLWLLTPPLSVDKKPGIEHIERQQSLGLFSLLFLSRALFGQDKEGKGSYRINVLTANMHCLPGDPPPFPGRATVLAAVKSLPRQYPRLSCHCIDVVPPKPGSPQEKDLEDRLLAELYTDSSDRVIAFRRDTRLIPIFDRIEPTGRADSSTRLGKQGVYVFIGGNSGPGVEMAQYIAQVQGRAATLIFAEKPRPEPVREDSNTYTPDSPAPGETIQYRDTTHWNNRRKEEFAFLVQEEAKIEKESEIKTPKHYEGLVENLNRLCSIYILDYFRKCGIDTRPGKRHKINDLKEFLDILPKFDAFFEFFLEVLKEDKIVNVEKGEVEFLANAETYIDPERHLEEALQKYPQFSGTIKMIEHCASHYKQALSGKIEAISVLYPEGKHVQTQQTYQNSIEHRRSNLYISLLKEFILKILDQAPQAPENKPFRILEIGAGNGIFTRVITPRLANRNVEYYFTDLGNFFVLNAKKEAEKLGFDFMKFQTFNISINPEQQNFSPAMFDMVVGFDVVSASRDIAESIENLKYLLVPDGRLLLIEMPYHERWDYMIFGVAEGWWYYENDKIRDEHALSLDGWEHVLDKLGFSEVTAFPYDREKRRQSDFGLIISRLSDRNMSPRSGDQDSDNPLVSGHIDKIKDLEKTGAEVHIIPGNLEEQERIRQTLFGIKQRFGRINGIFFQPDRTAAHNNSDVIDIEKLKTTLLSQIGSIVNLESAATDLSLDFLVYFSLLDPLDIPAANIELATLGFFLEYLTRYKSYQESHFSVCIHGDSTRFKGRSQDSGNAGIGSIIAQILDRQYPGVLIGSQYPAGESNPDSEAPDSPLKDDRQPLEPTEREYRRSELSSRYVPPHTDIEKILVGIWQEFFGIEEIGILDNFFELGGDSLIFITIAGRIHKALHVDIPINLFFSKPNITELAAYISSTSKRNIYASIKPVEKKEYYAVSSAQKRLYILKELDEMGTGYNLPFISILKGEIDAGRFDETFRHLINRHESLRTSFRLVGNKPVQSVYEKVEFAVERRNAPGNSLNIKDGEEKGELKIMIDHYLRPFNLAEPPLLRLGMIKENETGHLLVVVMHHIITDGISIALLIKEFTDVYGGRDLPPLKLHYKDYSEWQQTEEVKKNLEQMGEYWSKRFAYEPPILNLPYDFPRPGLQNFSGGTVYFEMSDVEKDTLNQIALTNEATLFMVILTIYNILLAKLSGQEDIPIGTPTVNRNHADLEAIIGMFANTVVLRNFPEGWQTFAQLLLQVKENSLKAFENQNYPFEELVEKVHPERDLTRNPLFDVMFTLQSHSEEDSWTGEKKNEMEGLQIIPFNYEGGISIFDLSLIATEIGAKLHFQFKYCAKLFKAATIERFVCYFKNILHEILNDPHKKIRDIDIISKEEKERFLYGFNDTQVEYPIRNTLHHWFEKQAADTPDGIALVQADSPSQHPGMYTYRELERHAGRLAHALKPKGASPGTVVAIIAEHNIDTIAGILGILKSGAAFLPIDPDFPTERIHYMLNDSSVRAIFTSRRVIKEAEIIEKWQGDMVYIEEEIQDTTPRQPAEIEAERTGMPNHNIDRRRPDHFNPAYIIYTSGSTGKPKGVMVEHRNIVNYISWAIEQYVQGEKLSFPLFTSLSFDLTITSIFTPLLSGGTVMVYEGDGKGPLIERVIAGNRVHVVKLTPSHLKLITEQQAWQNGPIPGSGIKRFIVGGEALETKLAQTIVETFGNHVLIYNEYGPTETTIGCMIYIFASGKDGRDSRQSVPIGVPAANVRIYLFDKNFYLVPTGAVGEIYISGDGVARGYVNRPGLTAEKFLNNPFLPKERMYRSGDLGRCLPDGNIEFLGRIDEQVKIRGYRIELGEIRDKLLEFKKNTPFNSLYPTGRDFSKIQYCKRCLLPDNYPGIRFDEEGVCNTCLQHDRYNDEVKNYFKREEDFQWLLEQIKKTPRGEYDCLLLYSGGKDSTYALYRLIDMGLKVLTFTFDNGYISEAAFANIKRTTTTLNVKNIICKADKMNNVFVESLNSTHSVCHGCWNALNAYGLKVAWEHRIDTVISGLSRGQIFEMRLEELFNHGIFTEDAIEENLNLFRKSFYSHHSKYIRLLGLELPEEAVEQAHFIDFFRYFTAPVSEIKDYLTKKGWIQPVDTGFCSSNCIINDVGIYAHIQKAGYHFYSRQLSWDCRLGCIPREVGLKELAFPDVEEDNNERLHHINKILSEIGYFTPPIKDAVVLDTEGRGGDRSLNAYLISDEELLVPELRDFLVRRLPDYMIPSNFTRVDEIPLTPNGKVDRKALRLLGKKLDAGVQYVAPSSNKEITIANIWKEVLELDDMGIHDNFFDLGGTSMDIIRVINRLQEEFAMVIPIVNMYRYSTIAALSRLIENDAEDLTGPSRREKRSIQIEKGKIDRTKRRDIRIRKKNER